MNRATRQAVASLRKAKRSGNALTIMLCIEDAIRVLDPQKETDKAKATRARKRADTERKIAKRRMTRNEVRAAVVERANGACEAAPYRDSHVSHYGLLEWDHWHGGSGDRKKRESVATTWLPCRRCHEDRTDNYPSAAYWNGIFALHCRTHGYAFKEHVEHAAVPRRSANGR